MTADGRIGVCSWSLRPTDPKQLAASLDRLQISGLQLALGPLIDDPEAWSDAPRLLRDAGIDILSGMMATIDEDYSTLKTIARTGGVRPDETWPANRDLAERVADLAGEHDIDLVTFHAGFIPEQQGDPDDSGGDSRGPERGRLIDRLRSVAAIFAERRLTLAFETGQETAETLLEALEELACPNVGVNFDPANMILYAKGDPVESLRLLAPHVVQIHVKDALPTETPGTWGAEVPAGQGAVDWSAFFDVAKSIDPPVKFVIEREAGADREDDICAARDLVVRHLG